MKKQRNKIREPKMEVDQNFGIVLVITFVGIATTLYKGCLCVKHLIERCYRQNVTEFELRNISTESVVLEHPQPKNYCLPFNINNFS